MEQIARKHCKTTHKVYFTPTATKNVETWNLTKRNKSKFQSMDMKSLKNTVVYRPVAGLRPRNGQWVQPLPCNRQINKHLFLSNRRWARSCGSNIQSIARQPPVTVEGLLEVVFFVGSALRLYSKDTSWTAVRWVQDSGLIAVSGFCSGVGVVAFCWFLLCRGD
jgi:hypothetical protein